MITPEQYLAERTRHKTRAILSQRPKKMPVHEAIVPYDKRTRKRLAKFRDGKRTVAIVGLAPSSCALAPFFDDDVDIWCLNEAHLLAWMKKWGRWNRYFQMHKPGFYQREADLSGMTGHYEWLQQEHDNPIYMLGDYDDVPSGVKYPLMEVCNELLPNLRVGLAKMKHFKSTFDYMAALAIYEKFERIEIYGFEMSGEYQHQRDGGLFWMGYALGRGIEVFLPEHNTIFDPLMYGYSYTTLKGERVPNDYYEKKGNGREVHQEG